MRVLWAILASIGLMSCTATAMPHPGVIVIDEDNGGLVSSYKNFYQRIQDAGIKVRVEGMCISACTLVLSLPKDEVCVTRTASFGFHLASVGDVADPKTTEALIRRYYPPIVQKWIKDHGPLTSNITFMAGAEVIDAGVFPECKD